MANIPFLLESKFSFNPSLQHTTFRLPPFRTPPIDNNSFKLNYTHYKLIKDYPKLKVKCTYHNPRREKVIISTGNAVGEYQMELAVFVLCSGIQAVVFLGYLLVGNHQHGIIPCITFKHMVKLGLNALACCTMCMLLGAALTLLALVSAANKLSVLKLQVGLSSTGKSLLQRDINRIAEMPDADTYSREGLSYALQETTLALLRNPECCISGYSSSSVYRKTSFDEVENRFNQICILERGKIDVETLVNVNNIGKKRETTQRSKDFCKEYVVITFIVGVEGSHKLPPIHNSAQLKEALQKLATLPLNRVQALAVLLTPQNENNTHLENYSLLRPI